MYDLSNSINTDDLEWPVGVILAIKNISMVSTLTLLVIL